MALSLEYNYASTFGKMVAIMKSPDDGDVKGTLGEITFLKSKRPYLC